MPDHLLLGTHVLDEPLNGLGEIRHRLRRRFGLAEIGHRVGQPFERRVNLAVETSGAHGWAVGCVGADFVDGSRQPILKVGVEAVLCLARLEVEKPENERAGKAEQRGREGRAHAAELALEPAHQPLEHVARLLPLLRRQRADRLDDRRVRLRQDLEVASRELEALKRQSRNTNVVADTRIAELDSRINELTQQRELNNRELRADGRILASRATDGFVVVDRGQEDNLRKGTRFTVFNRRGGKPVIKGSVEVVEVEARMAVCRVTNEVNANDPLIPGDMVHNPVYNPDDVKTFVIKGDFTIYSAEEIARFITESGGKVAKDLTTSSDYLIAGSRAEEALAKASKLGVSVLSEQQAIDLVRPRTRELLGQGVVVVLKGRFTAVSAGTIESLIERSGGRVASRVEPGVTMLIAGEDAADDIAKARALGIKVVDHANFTYLNEKN